MTEHDPYGSLRILAQRDVSSAVGPPVSVTDEILASCLANNHFGPLAFNLYKEASSLIRVICTGHLDGNAPRPDLDRNGSICTGLIVRISKLMLSVVKLSSDTEHAETVMILNRCIIESIVNLRYLLLKREDRRVYDRFVAFSLRPEAELFDFIQKVICEGCGKELEIERNMVSSILDTFEKSRISLDSARRKRGNWGGSFRDKLAALDMEGAYPALQMVPSHAVHGDWVDLLKNHLVPTGDRFEPKLEWSSTDGEMLGAVALFALEGALEYLDESFTGPVAEVLADRLEDLRLRIVKTELYRKDWQEVE